MVRILLFQLTEDDIHLIFKVLVVFSHLHRVYHLDERIEIFLFFGSFKPYVPDECSIQELLGFFPERIRAFSLAFCVLHQASHEFQHVFFAVDVRKRIVTHGFFEVYCIQHLDFVPVFLKHFSGFTHKTSFRISYAI